MLPTQFNPDSDLDPVPVGIRLVVKVTRRGIAIGFELNGRRYVIAIGRIE
jgi:hypothetical protein